MVNNKNFKKIILITGSSGLIGSALGKELSKRGYSVKGLDIRGKGEGNGDIRNFKTIQNAVKGCSGVIHLAAVSRVIDGERNPELCWDVNVNGITNVINSILQQEVKPWLIFSSSREVYGNVLELPVKELQHTNPINIYGESKVQSEVLVEKAVKNEGLQASILRFSNVFGGLNDYNDRVIPAFVRAALQGDRLRVDGDDNTFDFTYLKDVLDGISLTVDFLNDSKESLPPLHFVTGRPTTLRQLAEMVIEITSSSSKILKAPPRDYDVAKFYGCVDKAIEVLGWQHKTSIEKGLKIFVNHTRQHLKLPVNMQSYI